jgi:hypothetical protein
MAMRSTLKSIYSYDYHLWVNQFIVTIVIYGKINFIVTITKYVNCQDH